MLFVVRVLLAVAGPFAQLADVGAAEVKPNVIVVITDDQGYGDLSAHGNPILKTPQLDRLRSESVRLTDFHVAPMCTPTRGQLMTGVDCLRNGAMNVSSGRTLLRREFPTMAEIFAASGYATGHFGKWHLGDNAPYRPQDHGFHEAVSFPSSHISSAPDFWNNDYFDDTYDHNGKRQAYQGYCTDVFFGQAIAWMKGCVERRTPFFTYIATNAPHGPLFVPAKYREPYANQPESVGRFFGMIANIDENIGRLQQFLSDNGLDQNTLLIFLTDNGGTAGVNVFNAGMRGRKITLYEGGHRVPCFVKGPESLVGKPRDVDALTEVQDLLPTLIDLVTLQRPEHAKFDGISLAGLLRDNRPLDADRTLMIQFSRMDKPVPVKGDASVLWRRWRLVSNAELYDLATDFGQKTNVIDQHPDIASKLRQAYHKWWEEVSPRLNEHQAIAIGSPAENPTRLSAADWDDVFLDQSGQVREGLKRNGAWNIEVVNAGRYEIALRRWPEEAAVPMSAGIPKTHHADGEFPAGVALHVAKARLEVGGFDETRPVAASDLAATFEVSLPKGRTQLKSWLLKEDGSEICGAYYVTVTSIGVIGGR